MTNNNEVSNYNCGMCKMFEYFHGSAGICTVKNGCCCKKMVDCADEACLLFESMEDKQCN